MPTPHAVAICLSDEQQQALLSLVRAHSAPQAVARRARIILRANDDDQPTNSQIANELGCDNDTVALWRKRFASEGFCGLLDRPRSGRPPAFSPSTASACP